jgi:hypothetical protein
MSGYARYDDFLLLLLREFLPFDVPRVLRTRPGAG